jgi:hypothetical protein
MSNTTLKFGSNLAISLSEKKRKKWDSQKDLYRFWAIYRSKKTGEDFGIRTIQQKYTVFSMSVDRSMAVILSLNKYKQ